MANKLLLADGQYEVITVDTTLVGIAGKQYWYRNGSASIITVTYGGALKALNPNEVVGLVYDGSVWTELSGKDGLSDVLPIGGIFTSSAGIVPTGFVQANGQALSRSLYSLLNSKYADMGYPYGAGDGTTTFNVPDLPADSPFITIVNARRVPDQEYIDEIQIDSRLSGLEVANTQESINVLTMGAIADGVTDNTALFNSLLASYDSLFIPPTANGFAIAGVTIPDNKSIFGIGKASKIVSFNGANSALITLGNNNTISNLGFYSAEGKDSGKGNQVALLINNKFSNIVDGCYGEGLGGTLCRVINAVGVHQGNTITNCISANCNIGIDIAERGEYVKVTACSMYVNNVGLFVVGGNICVNGCTISDNTTGVYVGAGSNDAHGVINGCTINHNVNAVIVASPTVGAFLFSNCMIYFGNINLTGCTGIIFRGCDLSSVIINEDGCRGCYFKNCHEVGANVVINPNVNNDSEVFYLDMEWDSSVLTPDKKRMNGGYLELKQTVRTEYSVGLTDITWQNIVYNSIPANLSYTVQEFYDFDLATPFIHTGTKSVLTGFNVKMRSQLLVGNPAGTAWNSKDVTIRIIDSTGVCIGVFTPDRVDSNASATHTVQYHFDGIVARKEFKIVIENRTAGNMRIYEDQANVVVKNYLIVEGI